MKSKFRLSTTLFFVSVLFLFGLFIYNYVIINKTNKIIANNDSLLVANDTSLYELDVFDTATQEDPVLVKSFNKTELAGSTSYSVDVTYDVSQINIRAIANDADTTLIGNGLKTVKMGSNSYTITTTSKDGTEATYTLVVVRQSFPAGVHSTLLYSFKLKELDDVYINPKTKNYTVTIPSGWYFIDFSGTPYDGDATVTPESGCFDYVTETTTCGITVSHAGIPDTEYSVTMFKKNSGLSTDINYTGHSKSYTASYAGYYKLEAWGAQGGSDAGGGGGLGGYAVGALRLNAGDTIWATVGSQGAYCATGTGGGYNGGGDAGNYGCSGGGGGATHFSYSSGLLTSFEDTIGSYNTDIDTYRSSQIILVAGGGGGGGAWTGGGSGGGFRGNKGDADAGGTGGSQGNVGGGLSPGSFGHGGNRYNGDGGGGGAGWYGGGAGYGDVGGGGGSGYIGNINLKSVYGLTKHMMCYNCQENESGPEVLTYSTKNYSSNAVSDYAKRGNGYAVVTYLDLSENYYLSNLQVLEPVSQRVLEYDGGKTFVYNDLNYEITLAAEQTRIVIQASTDDQKMRYSGDLGEKRVPAGDHTFKITTINEYGETKTYNITTHRPPSDNVRVNEININGLLARYCATDFDSNQDWIYKGDKDFLKFCELYNEGSDYYLGSAANEYSVGPTRISWDPETHEYDLYVPARIKELSFEVLSDNENQVVTGGGRFDLEPGENRLTIDVVSEACNVLYGDDIPTELYDSCTNGYEYYIYRDYYHDADLANLYIDNSQITPDDWGYGRTFDLNFTDPGVLDYYFSVPYTWEYVKYLYTEVDVHGYYYSKGIQDATVEITGNENFKIGQTNIVTIKVKAPDYSEQPDGSAIGTVQEYKLHVYREYSDNIYLDSLQYFDQDVVELPITPAYNKVIHSYSVVVPTNNKKGYIRFKPAETSSSLKLRNDDTNKYLTITPNSDFIYFAELDLKRGENRFIIEVTAQDGEATGEYELIVNRLKSNDSSVNGLIAKTGDKYWTINPPYDPDVDNYTINVDPGTEYVDLIPITNDEEATYETLEGKYIECGTNYKTIEVKSEDETSSRRIYVTIVRPPFNIATLAGISITSGLAEGAEVYPITPTFEPGVFSYEATVENVVTHAFIQYIKGNKWETVVTNFSNGDEGVSLHTGANVFTFDVTAEDGITVCSYVLTVYRKINSNVTLQDLKIKTYGLNKEHDGTINEPVNDTTTSYTATADYYMTSARLIVTPKVNTVRVVPESPSATLNYGENEITFKLVTDDDAYQEDYKVTVTRIFNPDVGLQSLVLLDEWGNEHPIYPTFTPWVLNYTANISNGSNVVKFRALAASATASISFESVRTSYGWGVYQLGYGENTYKVHVTNTDTDTGITYTETYTVVVTRNLDSVACLAELEMYEDEYIGSSYMGPHTIRNYSPPPCEDTEYNVTIRRDGTVKFKWRSPERITQSVSIVGADGVTCSGSSCTGFVKGETRRIYVTVTSQDGSNSVTYTFNMIYPTYVGSNYLSNLKVMNGETEYPLNITFDPTIEDYRVNVTIPYEVSQVNIVATPEDPYAHVSGSGVVNVPTNRNDDPLYPGTNGADNVYLITVTPDTINEDPVIKSYTVVINREHGHEPRLSNLEMYYTSPFPQLVPSVNKYTFYEEAARTTEKAFDTDDSGPYYVFIDSYADHPLGSKNFRVTKTDNNGSVNIPNLMMPTPNVYVDYTVTGIAEDGFTEKQYNFKVMRPMGTLSYLSSLCVKNETTGNCEKMYRQPKDGDIVYPTSFHPTTEDYYVYVDSSFSADNELNENNIVYELYDGAATATRLTNPLALVRDSFVDYKIKVVSEDNASTRTYTVHVMLVLGDDARIKKVTIPKGFLLNKDKNFTGYNPDEVEKLDYYWVIPDDYYNSYTDENLGYEMFDKKAWSERTFDSTNKIITINTKSEDKLTAYTYNFIMKRYSDVNVTASKLEIHDNVREDPNDSTKKYNYKYTPELTDFVFEYTTHVYIDATALDITLELKDSGASISGPSNPVALTADEQDITYMVTSPDGTYTVPYVIHVKRDILTDLYASDLYLVDEGVIEDEIEDIVGPVCKGQQCILTPTFDPEHRGYMTTIPYEYKNMYFYVGLNEQQTAKFFDSELNEISNKTYRVNEDGGKDLVNPGYLIPIGENEVRINIYDGLGEVTTYYSVQLNRKKSNDASLESLEVWRVKQNPDEADIEYTLDPEFDPETLSYGVNVPETTTSVDLRYVTAGPGATVTVKGNTGLIKGINKATITVLAQDEVTERTYTVYINVGGDYQSFLSNITVSTGLKFYDLVPEFYKMETEYFVQVPSSTRQAIVEGVSDNTSIAVVGNKSYNLTTGKNDVYIKGQYYEEGVLLSETTYHLVIYRVYPNNVRLSYLDVREDPSVRERFDTGTTVYDVSVPAGTTRLTITAVPEFEDATVNIVGNGDFKTGINIVNVYVINEGGNFTKTYQLRVFVRPSNDASLAMIDVYSDVSMSSRLGVKNFDSTVKSYDMTVPADVDSVFVVGTPSVSTATVTGGGYNALSYGPNEIELIITAEDGSTYSTYKVNVYRKHNLLLKELSHDDEALYPLTPEFDPLVNDYKIEVPYDVKSLKFHAVAQAGSAVDLTYNAISYLEIGENTVTFTVRDPEGNMNVYTVIVDRVGSANNYLANLVPSPGMLSEDFSRTDQEYTLLFPDNIFNVELEDWIIIPEDENATYVVEGYQNLSPNKEGQQIKIIVTAQNGAKRTYTLNLEFLPPEYFKHYLSALWLDNGKTGDETVNYTISPKYDMEVGSYTATLPYGTEKVTIHAVPMNTPDKVYIDGTYVNEPSIDASLKNKKEVSLNFGRNVFKVKVDSGAAGYKVYTIIIYRTSSPDATLANLIVDGYTYTPIFNKKINDYYLTIPSSVTDVNVKYIASDPASTVVITGNQGMNPSKINEIKVQVTSPDGVTKRTYTIHVTMEADKDNYLDALTVQGFEIKPEFKKTNTGTYEVKVENTVSSVLVYADASSPTAQVVIDNGDKTFTGIDIVSGAIKLKPGNNYIQISVTSDSGDVRVYTVNVFKEYKTITSLLLLYSDYSDGETGITISPNGYSPAFDPNIFVYYETVPYNPNGFYNLFGLPADSSEKVKSSGNVKLKEGVNEVTVLVTAEDGVTTSTYKVYVTMEKGPSSKLKELTIGEGEMTPKFDKDTLYYYVEVPSEITNFDFYHQASNPLGIDKIVPEDSNATYTITGNSAFTQNGISTVKITVSCAGVADTVYTIEVYRSIAGDDKLDQLYIKEYTPSFTPTFSPLTLKYSKEVETEVDKVTVGAFRTDTSANITINGVDKGATGGEEVINLDYGDNIVYVKVTASNGAKRTYQIIINRKDTANFLLSLEANTGTWELTPTESLLKTKYDYELTLPNGVTKVKLKGTWSEGATVTNIDKIGTEVPVPAASNIIHTITVTSASGLSNTYNIILHGAKSAETDITLDTNHGTPDYLGDNKYELTVKDDASTIELIVTPKDEGAQVIKQPFYALNYGETTITFQVKSSDGTKTEMYTLTVYRGKDIEKIVPDKEKIVVVVDEDETITYTIEPADATSTEVTFVSLDTSMATVDADGKVTGVSKGLTKVEIRSVKDPEIKGIVDVYVLDKRISSDTLNVTHADDVGNSYNKYGIDYVSKIQPKTKINDLLDSFNNPASYLHIFSNGTELTDYTKNAGSGMVIKLIIGDVVYDEITVVIKGDSGTVDSPGNGLITAADTTKINNLLSGTEMSTPLAKAIMDVDYNGLVTAADVTKIKNYVSGTITTIE